MLYFTNIFIWCMCCWC